MNGLFDTIPGSLDRYTGEDPGGKQEWGFKEEDPSMLQLVEWRDSARMDQALIDCRHPFDDKFAAEVADGTHAEQQGEVTIVHLRTTRARPPKKIHCPFCVFSLDFFGWTREGKSVFNTYDLLDHIQKEHPEEGGDE